MNSSLVEYVQLSPNKTSPRNHAIDTVTIHCVVGQMSAESLGAWFAKNSTQASSNYGIDRDGRIALYVDEKDRSWCSSNADNDNRAITIEVASDTKHPYAVNEKAYASLIRLLADICKRNPGIGKLRWKGDKSLIGKIAEQNMTVHRWFAPKDCPGEYLYSRHSDIANQVNALLEQSVPEINGDADVETTIWAFLKTKGLNDFAIAGIMGNLQAESGLSSINLQQTYEKTLNHTDLSYTKAVDSGEYTNFDKDSAGYGLAQWTYSARKRELLKYAKATGRSVGNLAMQLEFLWNELQNYSKVMKTLNTATSVKEASDIVLVEYECPADRRDVIKHKRAKLGQAYYDKFADTSKPVSCKLYRVRKTWEDVGSQIGAYAVLTNAQKMADKNCGYFVFDEVGTCIYPEVKPVTRKPAAAKEKDNDLAGKYIVTTSLGLNLRYKPGFSSDDIIETIPYGGVVHCYGYFTTVEETTWLLVAHGEKEGYVHSAFVKKI